MIIFELKEAARLSIMTAAMFLGCMMAISPVGLAMGHNYYWALVMLIIDLEVAWGIWNTISP